MTVTIGAGKSITANVILVPRTNPNTQGRFTYNITLGDQTVIDSGTLTLTGVGDQAIDGFPRTVSNKGVTGEKVLPPGQYTLNIKVTRDDIPTGLTEVVYIIGVYLSRAETVEP